MKKRDIINTATYETGYEDFLIDVVEKYDSMGQENVFEIWIYRESMGVKMLAYGVPTRTNGGRFDGFCAGLEADDFDEFYDIYDEEVR